VSFEAVNDPSRVVFSENLGGNPADGIVDAEGNLIGSYRSFVGRRGHQLPKPRE